MFTPDDLDYTIDLTMTIDDNDKASRAVSYLIDRAFRASGRRDSYTLHIDEKLCTSLYFLVKVAELADTQQELDEALANYLAEDLFDHHRFSKKPGVKLLESVVFNMADEVALLYTATTHEEKQVKMRASRAITDIHQYMALFDNKVNDRTRFKDSYVAVAMECRAGQEPSFTLVDINNII